MAPWNVMETYLPLMMFSPSSLHQYQPLFVEYLRKLASPHGGWSISGCGQPNIVPIYGGIISLAYIGTPEAFEIISQNELYAFLLSIKNQDGSFSTYPGGESDIRSTFCAIFAAWMTGILTPQLISNVVDFIVSSQNYDGGFSSRPDTESHGGFTYCGVTALTILDQLGTINIPKLIRWIVDRQSDFAGGFNGRPNKLVDSCYTWWIGAAAKTLSTELDIPPFWNAEAITRFIVQSAQAKSGGLKDRSPSKADLFHTFFGFAGLLCCGDLDIIDSSSFPTIDSIAPTPPDLLRQYQNYFVSKDWQPNLTI